MKLFHYKQLLLEAGYATLDKTRPYSPDELSRMYGTDYKVHFDKGGELILGKVIENGKVIGVQSVHSSRNYFSQAIPYIIDKAIVSTTGGCGSTAYGAGFYTATNPSIINGYKSNFSSNFKFNFENIDDAMTGIIRMMKRLKRDKHQGIKKTATSISYASDLMNLKFSKIRRAICCDDTTYFGEYTDDIDICNSFEKTIESMSHDLWTKHGQKTLEYYSFLNIDCNGKLYYSLSRPLTSLALRLYYYNKYAPLTYTKYIREAINTILSPENWAIRLRIIGEYDRPALEVLDKKTLNEIINLFAYKVLMEEEKEEEKEEEIKSINKNFDETNITVLLRDRCGIDIPNKQVTKDTSFWNKSLNKIGLGQKSKVEYNRFPAIYNAIKSSAFFKKCTAIEVIELLQKTKSLYQYLKKADDDKTFENILDKVLNETLTSLETISSRLSARKQLTSLLLKFFSLLLKYGKAIVPEIANSIFEIAKFRDYKNPDYIMAYLAIAIIPEDTKGIDSSLDRLNEKFPFLSSTDLMWTYILVKGFRLSAFEEFARKLNITGKIRDQLALPERPDKNDKKYKNNPELFTNDARKYADYKIKYKAAMSIGQNKHEHINIYSLPDLLNKKSITIQKITEKLTSDYKSIRRVIKQSITHEIDTFNKKLKNKQSPKGGFTYVYFSKIYVKPGDVLPMHTPVLTNEDFLDLKKMFGKVDITREKCSKLPPNLHPCIKNMLTAEIDTMRNFFTWLLKYDGTLYDCRSRTGYFNGIDIHNMLIAFLNGSSVVDALQYGNNYWAAGGDQNDMNKVADIFVKCGINATIHHDDEPGDEPGNAPNYVILNKDITRLVAKLRFNESNLDKYKVIPTTREREAKTIENWHRVLNNLIQHICDKCNVNRAFIEKIVHSIDSKPMKLFEKSSFTKDNTDDLKTYYAKKSDYDTRLIEAFSQILTVTANIMQQDGSQQIDPLSIMKNVVMTLMLYGMISFESTYLFESYNRPITVGQLLNEYRFCL